MARPKKTVEIIEETPTEQVEEIQESQSDSPAKAAFRAHMERYAKQNPKKFARKQEALIKKLNSL